MTDRDPAETLGTLVEAAVAIAGFSGIAMVPGRRSSGPHTASDGDSAAG